MTSFKNKAKIFPLIIPICRGLDFEGEWFPSHPLPLHKFLTSNSQMAELFYFYPFPFLSFITPSSKQNLSYLEGRIFSPTAILKSKYSSDHSFFNRDVTTSHVFLKMACLSKNEWKEYPLFQYHCMTRDICISSKSTQSHIRVSTKRMQLASAVSTQTKIITTNVFEKRMPL